MCIVHAYGVERPEIIVSSTEIVIATERILTDRPTAPVAAIITNRLTRKSNKQTLNLKYVSTKCQK